MELIGFLLFIVMLLVGFNLLFYIVSGIISAFIWLVSVAISNIFNILVFGIGLYIIYNILW